MKMIVELMKMKHQDYNDSLASNQVFVWPLRIFDENGLEWELKEGKEKKQEW